MAPNKTALTLLFSLVLSLLSSGCQVGQYAKFDGTGPIPVDTTGYNWKESGGGEHGALVERVGFKNSYEKVTSSNKCRFKFNASLGTALSTPEGLVRSDGEAVYLHKIRRSGIDEGTLLAQTKNIQELDYQQSTLALRAPQGVYVKKPGQKLELFYKGPSLAFSLAAPDNALWIIKNKPCAVLEYWDLAKSEVQLRIPLPLELESSQLKIIRSKDLIAVYAYDRPIANALFIDAKKREIINFTEIIEEKEPTRAVTESTPPLLTPHSRKIGERISTETPSPVLGRIINYKSGEFLIIRNTSVIKPPLVNIVDSQFKIRNQPLPSNWPPSFEAVGWDDKGVVLISREFRYYIPADGQPYAEEISEFEVGKTANRIFNGFVAAGETAVYLPVNLTIGGAATALTPFFLIADTPTGFLTIFAVPVSIFYTFLGIPGR